MHECTNHVGKLPGVHFTLFQQVEEGGIPGLILLGEKVGDRRKGQDYVASTSSQVGIMVRADCDCRSVN